MILITLIFKRYNFLISIFYRFEHNPLNKHNYQHKLNIIYNIAHKNNFNLIIIKNIYNGIKEKIKHNT
jgi:hypothetical protein